MPPWRRSLGAALLAALLAACGDGEISGGAPLVTKVGEVLRKGNGAEPQTLDPHRAEDVASSNILRDLYEGLVVTGPGGTPAPGLARRWEVSADRLRWTFHLREDARWSNGDPVVAADFVAGMRRSVDPAVGSNYGMILAPIRNARAVLEGRLPPQALGVHARGASELVIELETPTPYLLGLLTHSTTYPIHRASLAAAPDRFTRPGHMVSNGAYRLHEWVVQSHVTLRKNPHYYRASQVDIEEVRYYALEDMSTELKRYRAGELDWTSTIPSAQFNWLKARIPEEVEVHPYLGTYYYGFNLTRAPFRDAPALRAALSMAVDREILTRHVTRAGEIPAYGWVPPALPGYEGVRLDYADWPRERRIAEARRLYRQAGYGPDNPLQVEIRYNTQEDHRKIALAVAQMWKQILGVQVSLLNEEWKVFLQNRKQKKVTQVFRAGWIGDYADPYTFLSLLHSDHGINDSGYRNPAYDKLLETISSLPAGPGRNRAMADAEAMLLADHPVLPLFHYVSRSLVKPWVSGYQANIMDHHYTARMGIVGD
jgi:oligopeptide transport system substrate-binding protein